MTLGPFASPVGACTVALGVIFLGAVVVAVSGPPWVWALVGADGVVLGTVLVSWGHGEGEG